MAADSIIRRAITELQGPIHGRLATIRGMCSDELSYEEIDGRIADADCAVHNLVEVLNGVGVRPVAHTTAELPVTVDRGTITMRPPLLFSIENPDGVLLEDLLSQLLIELAAEQERERCRETALTVTSIEEALLWRQRREVLRGKATIQKVPPRPL